MSGNIENYKLSYDPSSELFYLLKQDRNGGFHNIGRAYNERGIRDRLIQLFIQEKFSVISVSEKAPIKERTIIIDPRVLSIISGLEDIISKYDIAIIT